MAWALMNLDCSMAWHWSGKTYMGRGVGGWFFEGGGMGLAHDKQSLALGST